MKKQGERHNQLKQLRYLLRIPKFRLTDWQRRQIKVLTARVQWQLIGGEEQS